MELKWKIHKWDWNPTLAQLQTVGPTSFSIMELQRGRLIGWVVVRINTLFDGTTPNIEVGDEDDPNGFVTNGDVNSGIAAGLFSGNGDLLKNTIHKLYNETQIAALSTGPFMALAYTGVAEDGGNEVTQGSLSVIVVYADIE